jgi:Ca-activated chloride channel family protein
MSLACSISAAGQGKANMSDILQLTPRLNARYVPVSQQPRLVYLLLEVGGGADEDCLPVNLALVVDTSDSMHIRIASEDQFRELAQKGVLQEVLIDGVPAWESAEAAPEELARLPRKIDLVKQALRAGVEQLRSGDRFSLIAFAGQAQALIHNTSGSQKSRLLDAVESLDRLRLGDETYIGRGMALGFDELKTGAFGDLAQRMLVLTDGFTLDEDDWAVRARQAHIPISTMGLGGEFNEELMIPIADQTGGEAYLLEDPDDIPAAFAQELQRAQAIRYRNLELKLRPTQGVEVRAAHRVRPTIAPLEAADESGSYSFALGDLVEGDEPALLLELIVPPRQAGVYRLAQALLACDDPSGGLAGLKTRADVVAEYTPDPARAAQIVPQVMHVVEALSAYKLQRSARTDLEAGDVTGATRKLQAAATRLLDMGEEELAAEVQQQAAELAQRGQADPQRTKKLRYETRKLTQKLTS